MDRDFLKNHNIKVVYSPVKECSDDTNLQLFSQIASAEVYEEDEKEINSVLKNIEIDFDSEVKQQLITTILKVENTNIPPMEDNYSVKIILKDDSVYAYAPRPSALAEKRQLREITNDLLNRSIIKTSTSPYCARVVPVSKEKRHIAFVCRSSSIK